MVLCSALHHHVKRLRSLHPSHEGLVNLALLVDCYDCAAVLSLHVSAWLEPMEGRVEQNPELLLVPYVIHLPRFFESMTRRLILTWSRSFVEAMHAPTGDLQILPELFVRLEELRAGHWRQIHEDLIRFSSQSTSAPDFREINQLCASESTNKTPKAHLRHQCSDRYNYLTANDAIKDIALQAEMRRTGLWNSHGGSINQFWKKLEEFDEEKALNAFGWGYHEQMRCNLCEPDSMKSGLEKIKERTDCNVLPE